MRTLCTLGAIVGWPLLVIGAAAFLLGLWLLVVGGKLAGLDVILTESRGNR